VVEAGTHSPWVSRWLIAQGFEAIVANPRRVRLIAQSDAKSDEFDAEVLARLGRADPKLLSPIAHRSAAVQRDRILLQARDGLVRARTGLINRVRGFAKSLGVRLPGGSAETFAKRPRAAGLEELFPGCPTLLETIARLTEGARRLEREIERVGEQRYPVTKLLGQVPGVGPITSLAFVLTIEDPQRFARSRAVGAYLGLRPRRRSSGERSPQLPITKAGTSSCGASSPARRSTCSGPLGRTRIPRGPPVGRVVRSCFDLAPCELRGSRARRCAVGTGRRSCGERTR